MKNRSLTNFFVANIILFANFVISINAYAAKVTFSWSGNGTLTATVDGVPIDSGDDVETGKSVVFTATPVENQTRVNEWWTVNGAKTRVLPDANADFYMAYTYTASNISGALAVEVAFERDIAQLATTDPVGFLWPQTGEPFERAETAVGDLTAAIVMEANITGQEGIIMTNVHSAGFANVRRLVQNGDQDSWTIGFQNSPTYQLDNSDYSDIIGHWILFNFDDVKWLNCVMLRSRAGREWVKSVEIDFFLTVDQLNANTPVRTEKSLDILGDYLEHPGLTPLNAYTFKDDNVLYFPPVQARIVKIRLTEVGDVEPDRYATINPGFRRIKIIETDEPTMDDATLRALTVSSGGLSSAFRPELTDYTVDVPFEIDAITVNAVANNNDATVEGNGDYPLVVGENLITVTVTAADGSTTEEYNLTIVRDIERLFPVTFGGTVGGTVTATVDYMPINSGDKVLLGKTVVFTATPIMDYSRVNEWWEVNGEYTRVNPGDNSDYYQSTTHTITNISGAVNVTVTFERDIAQLATTDPVGFIWSQTGEPFERSETAVPDQFAAIVMEANITGQEGIIMTNIHSAPFANVRRLVQNGDQDSWAVGLAYSPKYTENNYDYSDIIGHWILFNFDEAKWLDRVILRSRVGRDWLKSVEIDFFLTVDELNANTPVKTEKSIDILSGYMEHPGLTDGVSTFKDDNVLSFPPVQARIVKIRLMEAGDVDPTRNAVINPGFRRIKIIETDNPVDDAALKSLDISVGELKPDFRPDIVDYTVYVANSVDEITITGVARNENASVSGNGLKSLNIGNNEIIVTVTSESNNKTLDYKVTVLRDPVPSTDAALISLDVSRGTLAPAFAADEFEYTVYVEYNIEDISITCQTNHEFAQLTGDGAHTLNVGENPITIAVTAEDGITTQEYIVTVVRDAPSDNATLKSLVVSPGTLAPDFADNVYEYDVDVANSVSSITITAEANHDGATVAGNGSHTLITGLNEIKITVTAEDGTTKLEYNVSVTRVATLSDDATLKSLNVTPGTLAPAFAANVYEYDVDVANSVSSITITAEANHDGATITGNGSHALDAGNNLITITVTAEDGTTKLDYKITVVRAFSDDATLKSLTVNPGTLEPAFAANVYEYNVSVANNVNSITITVEANDDGATVTGDGAHELNVGDNLITITVTAENGTSELEYKITVERALPTNVEYDFVPDLAVYPNPFSDNLFINGAEGCTLQVLNAAGILVHTQKIENPNETLRFNELPAGVYFFQLEKDGYTKTIKLIQK